MPQVTGFTTTQTSFSRITNQGLTARNVVLATASGPAWAPYVLSQHTGIDALSDPRSPDLNLVLPVATEASMKRILSLPYPVLETVLRAEGMPPGEIADMTLILLTNLTLDRSLWPDSGALLPRSLALSVEPLESGPTIIDFAGNTSYIRLSSSTRLTFRDIVVAGAPAVAEFNAALPPTTITAAMELTTLGMWPIAYDRCAAITYYNVLRLGQCTTTGSMHHDWVKSMSTAVSVCACWGRKVQERGLLSQQISPVTEVHPFIVSYHADWATILSSTTPPSS